MIQNVETLANVPVIMERGAEWFASLGTPESKGTKVFALTGSLNNTGLIEVPMGITLREIVEEMGGGIPGGRAFKAAQTGGPSGGCIPAQYLDTPVDYENLQELGSMMGSGGLVVMDDTASMPEIARFYMEFCRDESCGKCIPCRAGTVKMHAFLDRICRVWVASVTCSTSRACARRYVRRACAASGRALRTRSSPRSSTSATSTSRC
jgi:bidirectional [NiFe] hydrogenase diaphorase subunit